MERNEILIEMNQIFKNVFKNQTIDLNSDTNANDIDEWDSLNHAILISNIEKHFRIRFKFSEMLRFKNVGNICEAIEQKIK